MAGALTDYYEGTDAIAMSVDATWRTGTTDAANANYPDLLRVPKGCVWLEVIPTTNNLRVVLEGVTSATDRAAAHATTKAGTVVADKGGKIPVQPGQYVAIFGATVGTVYEMGFYTRDTGRL